MATVVEVWNLALARLGDSGTVTSTDPPEESVQAGYCSRFYELARDTLLEAHPWKFALRREALSALSDQDTYEWAYAYGLPSQMIRCLAVLSETGRDDDDSQDYAIQTADDGTQYLLTDQQDAHIIYIWRQEDTTRYSPMAIDALSWLLAAHVAGPMIKGDEGRKMAQACFSAYRGFVQRAAASDANQRKRQPTHTPAWIGGR